MVMKLLEEMNGAACACGKQHSFASRVVVGEGVLDRIPELLASLGGTRAYVLCDRNTYQAAGRQICALLERAGFPYHTLILQEAAPEPDAHSVGNAMLHWDKSCDVILGVGSGVINDIGKLVSLYTGTPYLIAATAPSMDGYASGTSSMTRDGLKVSIPSRCADVILGDTRILCQAPLKLMKAGLGDMLAKYVSICEWRLSQVINGEYYCEKIAELIRQAVKRCVDNAAGLLNREEAAVRAVFEGLIAGGVAMNYAGISRPASGVEHYLSHVLDMRGAALGTPVELHGLQCAVGTLIAIRLYEKIKQVVPDREQALAHGAAFDFGAWSRELRALVGKGAQSMIDQEEKEQKYDPRRHARRLEIILARWPELLEILEQELPRAQTVDALLEALDAPRTLTELGTEEALLPKLFLASKDIRDKYVLSRLWWDLGLPDALITGEVPMEK